MIFTFFSGTFFFAALAAYGQSLFLISPNGGEWWLSGASEPIAWHGGAGISHVRIEFSADAGHSWSTIATRAQKDGAHVWLVPDTVSNRALIRISDAGGSGAADTSEGAFVLTREALVNFTESSGNPIFTAGPAGSWDEGIRERGSYLFDNGEYHMWYGGWRGVYSRSKSSLVKIGYATSADGIHWRRYDGNPVSAAFWAEDFCVLKSGDTFYLYAEDEFTGDGDGAHIDLYTSTDKINWSYHGTVLAPGRSGWEDDDVGTPVVWKEGNDWYMLYEGAGSAGAGRVGLATSQDGRNWTRNPGNPVLANPRRDDLDIALDSIIKINGVYHAYGHYDIGPDTWVGGLFISSDLISWQAYPGNPVTASSPVILDNGQKYFMYTVRHIGSEVYQYHMSYAQHAPNPSSPALALLSPNGGERWAAGSIQKILWKAPNALSSVRLEYSIDRGAQWTAIAATAANDGSYNWLVPHAVSNECLVRISDADGANLMDASDLVFQIAGAPAPDFSDAFNGGALDENIWRRGAHSGNYPEVAEGALHLQSAAGASGWIHTRDRFAGRNKIVQVRVVQPNADGALGMSPTVHPAVANGFFNEPDWYRFYNYRSGNTGPYKLFVQWKRNGVEGGVDVAAGVDFSAGFYLRLRTNDARIFFEYSLDGSHWTTAHGEKFSLPGYTLDNLFAFELSANDTPSKGEWVLDDFAISSTTPASGDTVPPAISPIAAGNIGAGRATIMWNTDEPADAQVEYGLTAAYGSMSPRQEARTTNHAIGLTGLSANTTYHVLVKSRDASGNLAVSGGFTFKTGAATAVGPPAGPAALPQAFAVASYPNPFNLATRIRCELPHAAEIDLGVFDLGGNAVQELACGEFEAGRYEVLWHGKNKMGVELCAGVYFIRLLYRARGANEFTRLARRVLLIK